MGGLDALRAEFLLGGLDLSLEGLDVDAAGRSRFDRVGDQRSGFDRRLWIFRGGFGASFEEVFEGSAGVDEDESGRASEPDPDRGLGDEADAQFRGGIADDRQLSDRSGGDQRRTEEDSAHGEEVSGW